ncbi:MAG: hypothetical protein AAF989_02955 [Planctomycetota bacterium]
MPFLRGSLAFERFRVTGFEDNSFSQDHIELLAKYAAGKLESHSIENVLTGFLGGHHLFDQDFDLGKNLINDAVHCGVRVDSNQIPAAIRAAWLQMELAGLARDSPSGRPTKAQRKEAKEAVEQRCEVEAASGKYRKMQSFPILWDHGNEVLYFGGSVGTASAFCIDLVERTFNVELRRMGAVSVAKAWAIDAEKFGQLDDLTPAPFHPTHTHGQLPWSNEHSDSPDFLGNEFLLWLWWKLENESDTFDLEGGSEVTAMLSKTLTLECPAGESGKETITSESPVQLPEAMQAIRSGKLPRKTGMTIVRDGRCFDLVLQAETLAISGAKINLDEEEDFDDEDRIDAIRTLSETVDQMLVTYCALRCDAESWHPTHEKICQWLDVRPDRIQKAA